MKNTTENYRVRCNGTLMPERWGKEASAIRQAREHIAAGYDATVEYWSKSGTARSCMQVWPTKGDMYSWHQ